MYLGLFLVVFLFFWEKIARRAEASDEKIADYVDKNKDAMLQDWLEAMQIPGKSREEQKRTAWFEKKFKEIGLNDVFVDEVGNVSGFMKGAPGAETIIVTGHMDSVFANDTVLNPEIKEGWIHCPGSSDDVPAPVALLWLKKALDSLKIVPSFNLVFLATVQEEVGLRGMKHYWANLSEKPDMVIAIDGNLGAVTAGGLGVHWYKAYAKTPAGHTLKSTGKPSAVKSLALGISSAYAFQKEQTPPIFLNLGVIGGGTTENAVCEEAWVTLDMRSPSPDALQKLESDVFTAMEKSIVESGAAFRKELLMDITAGQLPNAAEHKVVKTALEVLKTLGYDSKVDYMGATDGNVAIANGVPTVSIGIVEGENWHSLQERARVDSFAVGMKQLLMLILRLS